MLFGISIGSIVGWLVFLSFVGLIAAWLAKSIVVVKDEENKIIMKYGGKTDHVKRAGVHWIGWDNNEYYHPRPRNWTWILGWPLYSVRKTITIRTLSKDYKDYPLNCNIIDEQNGNKVISITNLVGDETSVQYKINFFFWVLWKNLRTGERENRQPTYEEMLERVTRYYEYVQVTKDEDGNEFDNFSIIEKQVIKDKLEDTMRNRVKLLDLFAALKFRAKENSLAEIVQALCNNEFVPIEIVDIIINKPFKVVDPKIKEMIEERSQAAIKYVGEEKKKALELMQATKEIAIAEEKGKAAIVTAKSEGEARLELAKAAADAQVYSLQQIFSAFGIDNLTDEQEKIRQRLSVKALQAWETMAQNPGAKFVISSNVLSEINGFLSSLKG